MKIKASTTLGGGVRMIVLEDDSLHLEITDDDDKVMVHPFSYGVLDQGRLDYILEQTEKLREHCVY